MICRIGVPPEQVSFFELPEFWSADERKRLSAMPARGVVDRLDELLFESVRRHMFADVRVGAFCSGGVDSSLLMAMAARQYTDLGIFHANVKGQWSEHDAAASLAKHLKLDLKTVDVTDDDFVDRIPEVTAHYEHPFTYHPNCAPLMMVSELARDNGVKGLLSGEGSDECFLGYPWLGRKRLVDTYYRAGRSLRRLVHRIPDVGQIAWPHDHDRGETVRDLLNRREIAGDRAAVRAAAAQANVPIADEDLWTMDYLGHHLRSLLHRNDTMGMAASIEARFPFLDHDVVSFADEPPGVLQAARLRVRAREGASLHSGQVGRASGRRSICPAGTQPSHQARVLDDGLQEDAGGKLVLRRFIRGVRLRVELGPDARHRRRSGRRVDDSTVAAGCVGPDLRRRENA